MRLSTACVPFLQTLAVLSMTASTASAFTPSSSSLMTSSRRSTVVALASTVAPDATTAAATTTRRITIKKTPFGDSSAASESSTTSRPRSFGSPLSMPFDDLASELGGREHGELAAKLVWDCYQIGIDALQLFGNRISLDWHDDYESLLNLLPRADRTAKLSEGAQARMKQLYRRIGVHENTITETTTTYESRVASLSGVTRSAQDGTTKLILWLAKDDSEIETVIDGSTVRVATKVVGDDDNGRALTADEIVAQVVHAKRICRYVEDLPSLTGVELLISGDDSSSSSDSIAIAANVLEDKRCFGFEDGRVNIVAEAMN